MRVTNNQRVPRDPGRSNRRRDAFDGGVGPGGRATTPAIETKSRGPAQAFSFDGAADE